MFFKYLTTSLIILFATSCTEEDCSTVLCAGPPSLTLRVIENGDNVFENEIYTLEDVAIIGENSTQIFFEIFSAENGESILLLYNFPWQVGENNYTLTFAGETSVDLSIEIFLSENGGCCGGIEQLESFSINGSVT